MILSRISFSCTSAAASRRLPPEFDYCENANIRKLDGVDTLDYDYSTN